MTTPITKEWLQQTIAEYEASRDEIPFGLETNSAMELEAFKIALAAMDAEPVAWTDEQELRDVERGGCGYLFTCNPVTPHADERRVIKLYTAPPAPVVNAEPVADVVVWHKEGEERTCDIRWRRFDVAPGPLFAVAQPVAVDNTFIPKNLDRALGVVGVALPESKEEFNFQIERWIQRLIDRVIRYAEEFKEQPAPVVDAEPAKYHIGDTTMQNVFKPTGMTDISDLQAVFDQIEIALNSPLIPDGCQLVPKRLTAENGAKGALSGEFSETKFINCPECFGDEDCETCDGSGRIEISVPVTWSTIKAIWAKGVEHFSEAPQQEVKP